MLSEEQRVSHGQQQPLQLLAAWATLALSDQREEIAMALHSHHRLRLSEWVAAGLPLDEEDCECRMSHANSLPLASRELLRFCPRHRLAGRNGGRVGHAVASPSQRICRTK